MQTTKLSNTGQISIPQSIREARHWRAGMEFMVEECDDGLLLRPVKPFESTRLEDVIGCAGYRGPAKTLEQMEEAIAQGARWPGKAPDRRPARR